MGDQSTPKIVGHKMPSSGTILARLRKDLVSPLSIFADMFTHCYKKETSDVAILLCYGEKCEDQHHQGCW